MDTLLSYLTLMHVIRFGGLGLMVYYLVCILYLFYTLEMMLGQKLIQAMSYFISKCVVKRQRQVSSMKTHLSQGLLMRTQCTGRPGSLKMKWELGRWGAWWPLSQVDSDQLKAIIKTIHLKLLENLSENPMSEFNINQHRKGSTSIGKWKGKKAWWGGVS